jgi:hypothetical protein
MCGPWARERKWKEIEGAQLLRECAQKKNIEDLLGNYALRRSLVRTDEENAEGKNAC